MSTLYRCDTCGKLLRHCAPHSREIAPPVVLRGVPEFHHEYTFCQNLCFVRWLSAQVDAGRISFHAAVELDAIPMVELRTKEGWANAGTTPGGNAVQNDAP